MLNIRVIIDIWKKLLNRSQIFFKQTSVENSMGSLIVCYISFHTINLPSFHLYLFPVTMKYCHLWCEIYSLIDHYRHFRGTCCLSLQGNLPDYLRHIANGGNLHVKPYLGKMDSTNPDLTCKGYVKMRSHTDTSIHPGFQNKSLITKRKEMKR
jgi:hypothetical protein